ncbi:Putative phosphotransferase yqfL [Rickettsiales bacterium Ac37b]|nr:Putative phosphotransferase yqfL [Rickettsiales bacterium Ac37b]
MRKFDLHLVSDSTGETVCGVARAALVQFDGIEAEEHIWSLIRDKEQLTKVIKAISDKPGVVMYTIVEEELRNMLREHCAKLSIPCIPVLSRAIADLSNYLNIQTTPQPGKQHEMDNNYFIRVEAVNFSIAHDDGQSAWDIDEADIILVGVSRTSKSPTCMYLAHRGYKAANIPYVHNCELPASLFTSKKPLIVALTISPDRLLQIRKSRLLSLSEITESDYINEDKIKEELNEANKIFIKNNWPIIDVTKRSVEEITALIIQYYNENKIK